MSVQKSVKRCKAIVRKVAAKLPEGTAQGFDHGRQLGRSFIENVPYGAGVVAGLGFGIVEGAIGVLATPVNTIFRWVLGDDGQAEGESGVEAE